MFRKLRITLKTLWTYLFNGLHSAEKTVMGNKEDALNNHITYEQQQEQDSVWQDLLKGELTQRVIDLRYETAHADRESKNYSYIGGGMAKKKIFTEYKGKIDNKEDYNIILVQDNNEDYSTLDNYKTIREFRIKLIYSFFPRFRFDRYIKKVIFKEKDNETFIDVYVSKYHEKYDNEHKFFLAEIKRIINGDRRSDLLEIEKMVVPTFKAFGAPDGVTYTFKNFNFINIREFDGSYILTFSAKIESMDDFIDSVYNAESERKFLNKEKRENSKISYTTVDESYDKKEDDERYNEKLIEVLNRKVNV